RGMRPRAVLVGGEVRIGHRLAELLGADRGEPRRDRPRRLARHGARRSDVCALRRTPRARVRRRPRSHRTALLHELRGTRLRGGDREEVTVARKRKEEEEEEEEEGDLPGGGGRLFVSPRVVGV